MKWSLLGELYQREVFELVSNLALYYSLLSRLIIFSYCWSNKTTFQGRWWWWVPLTCTDLSVLQQNCNQNKLSLLLWQDYCISCHYVCRLDSLAKRQWNTETTLSIYLFYTFKEHTLPYKVGQICCGSHLSMLLGHLSRQTKAPTLRLRTWFETIKM